MLSERKFRFGFHRPDAEVEVPIGRGQYLSNLRKLPISTEWMIRRTFRDFAPQFSVSEADEAFKLDNEPSKFVAVPAVFLADTALVMCHHDDGRGRVLTLPYAVRASDLKGRQIVGDCWPVSEITHIDEALAYGRQNWGHELAAPSSPNYSVVELSLVKPNLGGFLDEARGKGKIYLVLDCSWEEIIAMGKKELLSQVLDRAIVETTTDPIKGLELAGNAGWEQVSRLKPSLCTYCGWFVSGGFCERCSGAEGSAGYGRDEDGVPISPKMLATIKQETSWGAKLDPSRAWEFEKKVWVNYRKLTA